MAPKLTRSKFTLNSSSKLKLADWLVKDEAGGRAFVSRLHFNATRLIEFADLYT